MIDDSSKGAEGVKFGNLNGDGRLDIITGCQEGGEVRVYLNPGPRQAHQPWPRVTVGTVTSSEVAIFADLNGGGRLEVISCTEGSVRTVYRQRFQGDVSELLKPERWRTTAFPATSNAQQWMRRSRWTWTASMGLMLCSLPKVNTPASAGCNRPCERMISARGLFTSSAMLAESCR